MVKRETPASGGNAPSPSDNAVLCAAVHQFLTGVDPKLAKLYKYKNHKINKDLSGDVPEDLPSLGQIVASYQVISVFCILSVFIFELRVLIIECLVSSANLRKF